MTTASTSVPGFGAACVEATDRHPGLVWLAAAGLTPAVLLGALGMPPVELHLPTHDLGIMGPLCGMTRSVARAATGDPMAAWRYNPGGLALVAGAWASVARSAVGGLTGRWVNMDLVVTRGGWWTIAVAMVVLGLNQQLHAELLA